MNELVIQKEIVMPRDALGMMTLAQHLSKATGIPQTFRNPADLCMALIVLNDLGIKNPILALQEISFVRGNPMFSGKLCLALANTSSRFAERLDFTHGGEGDGRFVRVSGRLRGEHEPRVVDVILKDVRTTNDVWKKQPDQQLVYAGARIWMRRHTPEIILGMWFDGETIDVTPTTPTTRTVGAPLRLNPSASQDERTQEIETQIEDQGAPGGETVGPHEGDHGTAERVPDRSPSDAERAATEPFVIPRPDDSNASWATWWGTLMAYVKAAPDAATVNDWTTKNAESMAALRDLDKSKHSTLIDIIKREIASRST